MFKFPSTHSNPGDMILTYNSSTGQAETEGSLDSAHGQTIPDEMVTPGSLRDCLKYNIDLRFLLV